MTAALLWLLASLLIVLGVPYEGRAYEVERAHVLLTGVLG